MKRKSTSAPRSATRSTSRPKRKKMLVFGRPVILEDEIREVVATMRSGWLGTGPRVAKFEEAFRKYAGAAHAMAVNSCTAGLHLSLLALGLKPGAEVITTPMTFCATANAIIHAGCVPVFADCERDTMNISPDQIAGKVSERTLAVLPVHFAGRPCDMAAIMAVARARSLRVVEDCAHAVEATIDGRHVGTFGDLGCFSFYVTKNVTTVEGGMVAAADPEFEGRIKVLALHGMTKDAWKRFSDEGYKHYQVVEPGFKYNMTDIQAAVGLHQLARVEANYKRRTRIWARYMEAFGGLPCRLPSEPAPGTRHARHLFTLVIDTDALGKSRDDVLGELTRDNIGCGVHYTALHLHPYYRERFGYKEGDFPNAEYIGERTLSIPLSPGLTDDDADDVIAAVRKALGG